MEFSALASGSKANCFYLSDGSNKLLVDCGLSAKRTAERLSGIGVDPNEIDAIIVTHEHADHTSGVRVFAKRHDVRVYVNSGTLQASKAMVGVPEGQITIFQTGSEFTIGSILFEPFRVDHDAADPVGFRVSAGCYSLGILTDLGQLTTLVREKTRGLSGLVLESNHDVGMLWDAPYPPEIKQRIKSRKGHLNNEQASELVSELSLEKDSRLQLLVGAHISENSNCPKLVVESFRRAWKTAEVPEIIAANVHEASNLFKFS